MTEREELYWKLLAEGTPESVSKAYSLLEEGRVPIIVNITGVFPDNAERRMLDQQLFLEKQFSLRNVPYDSETGEVVVRRTCFGYRDSVNGLGKWAKNMHVDVVGQLNKKSVSLEEIVEDIKYLSSISPSMQLVIHVGSQDGSTKCENTIVCKNGNVTIYPPKIEKLRWFTDSEIKSRIRNTNITGKINWKERRKMNVKVEALREDD